VILVDFEVEVHIGVFYFHGTAKELVLEVEEWIVNHFLLSLNF